MARKKKTIEGEEKIEVVSKANVYNKNGNFVRTYDEETHGEDFKELADQYAKKIGGKVK